MFNPVKQGLFGLYAKVVTQVFSLVPQPKPLTLIGAGTSARIGPMARDFGWHKPLIVTDKILIELGILDSLTQSLEANGIDYVIFDGILPDPTYQVVQQALDLLKAEGCDSVIAVGGGSAIDASKVIKVAATHNKPIRKLAGMFKLSNAGLPFVAIPTTAGTGSEVTLAAVISDSDTHEKTVVIDPRVLPNIAVLDAQLQLKLPPAITAATAIDALTHAVEAYIGRNKSAQTDAYAVAAIKLIFANVEGAYNDGSRIEVREPMVLASYYAGLAFTKAFVGYVHAIAHKFGYLYQTPHGLANAVMLPHVMEYYLDTIPERFAELAIATGLGRADEGQQQLARKFVDKLFALNKALNIPLTLDALQAKDIPMLAKKALQEAHCTPYPVPKYLDQRGCESLIRKVLAC